MNIRKLALSILALALIGGATAGASDVIRTWKGKAVRVEVNGSPVQGGGLLIDGEIYVPLGALSESLQAFVRTDEDTVYIDKPNAHLLVFSEKGILFWRSEQTFGEVILGKYEFKVHAQVDNVRSKVYSLKTAVVDPNGKTLDEQEHVLEPEHRNRDVIWYTTPNLFKISFNTPGQYMVKFYMKTDSEKSDYFLVGEKAIVARDK